MNELIKKLCMYSLDCVQSTQKSSSFLNLKNKKADIIGLDANLKKIIELKTKATLNKNTMSLIYGGNLWIKNEKKNIYTPLLYTDSVNIDNDYQVNIDYDSLQFNFNVISVLIDNDSELIEFIINELMQLSDLHSIDLMPILTSLLKLPEDYKIFNQDSIILCKLPEDNAGLIKELKEIIKEY